MVNSEHKNIIMVEDIKLKIFNILYSVEDLNVA